MGRILVTGAAGFLGHALVYRMAAHGRDVRAATRRLTAGFPLNVKNVSVGDLARDPYWSEALSQVDAVVHCAGRAHILSDRASDPLTEYRAVNTAATIALAEEAVQAGVRRFVFISSIGVNGAETKGQPFRHDDAPNPHSPYAVSKREAEEGLRALSGRTGLEVVIIRPPLILGPNAKGNLASLDKLISSGLPLPFGSASRNRRDFVTIDNLCDLIEVAVDHPAAAGQTFLASDGTPISTRTLIEQMAVQSGRKAALIPVPTGPLGLALRLAGKGGMASQLFGDLEVDISHTRQTLGWEPVVKPR